MANYIEASSKSTLVAYQPFGYDEPVVVTASAIDEWIMVDEVPTAAMESTIDGFNVGHVKANHVTGKLKLNPFSPAFVEWFIKVSQENYDAGFAAPGKLTVATLNGALSVYTNFIITTRFGGYNIGERLKDVEVGFASDIPNSSIVGDLLQAGLNAYTALAGALR